jgi:hypothetical protein
MQNRKARWFLIIPLILFLLVISLFWLSSAGYSAFDKSFEGKTRGEIEMRLGRPNRIELTGPDNFIYLEVCEWDLRDGTLRVAFSGDGLFRWHRVTQSACQSFCALFRWSNKE